jgi:hypothetical protein
MSTMASDPMMQGTSIMPGRRQKRFNGGTKISVEVGFEVIYQEETETTEIFGFSFATSTPRQTISRL